MDSGGELDVGHHTLSGASANDTPVVLSFAGTLEVISTAHRFGFSPGREPPSA
jgi:hypothetical protein